MPLAEGVRVPVPLGGEGGLERGDTPNRDLSSPERRAESIVDMSCDE
jgi:hypothetical protein